MYLLRNAAICTNCGEYIESKHGWDCKICSCRNAMVDGGTSWIRGQLKPSSWVCSRHIISPYQYNISVETIYPYMLTYGLYNDILNLLEAFSIVKQAQFPIKSVLEELNAKKKIAEKY